MDDDTEAEFVNIKNQIVKQFYAEYDVGNRQKILDMIGCRTIDFPALIDITNIGFMIHSTIPNHIKRFISISKIKHRNVTHSVTQTLKNNYTSKQEVSTEPIHSDVTQEFDVTIGKTEGILCGAEKPIPKIMYSTSQKMMWKQVNEVNRS